MSQFDAETFMSEPCEDTFYNLKKDELISLAKHLKLEVKKAMRKHQILNIIVEHLVSLKVFEETVLETVETFDSEVKKQQLQLEFKKLKMQERMEEKQRKEREEQPQFESEKEETERQERLEREEKERQERMEEKEGQERIEEKERQERMEEKERQERRQEKERQERLEREKMEPEHESEMRKLELQVKLGCDPSVEKSSAKFDVTKHIKFVPPFQQADADKYFLHFEKVAGNLKCPK